jgi:hypothetical protein
MSIYDNGTQYPWEIWVGLIIAGVVLYFVVRATRKADRRHNYHMSHTANVGSKTTGQRPTTAPRRPSSKGV